VRPLQQPIYVFALDVSPSAVSSGMFRAALDAISSNLDHIAGGPAGKLSANAERASVTRVFTAETLVALVRLSQHALASSRSGARCSSTSCLVAATARSPRSSSSAMSTTHSAPSRPTSESRLWAAGLAGFWIA
jgi:hypothetical protein